MAYRDTPFEQMNRLFEQMRRSMWDASAFDPLALPRQSAFGDRPTGDREMAPGDREMTPSDRAMVPFPGRRDGWGVVDTNVTVDETDDGFVVTADLPGFETEDLSIRFDDGVLTVDGESEVTEASEHGSRRRSRRVRERVSIPAAVDVDGIEASYRNGVLEVALPMEEDHEDDGHRIDID